MPIRLGQEFSGYAQQARNGLARLAAGASRASPSCRSAARPWARASTRRRSFAPKVIARLAERTGSPFVPAPNRFEAMAGKDAAVETSGALKTIAVSLTKIANDIRWLASGPRCGIGEISIPSLQPGSSIMPGKVNPVIPEAVLMVAAQVVGNDATITLAGMSGNFELNVMMPVIAYNLLQSIEILANAARLLAEKCVDGIQANRERCEELVEQLARHGDLPGAEDRLRRRGRDRQGVGEDRQDGARALPREGRSCPRTSWPRRSIPGSRPRAESTPAAGERAAEAQPRSRGVPPPRRQISISTSRPSPATSDGGPQQQVGRG